MAQHLIIIRGNSGSGKSTVAKLLREQFAAKTTFIQQDVIRREILKEKDNPGNPSIDLIALIARYGKDNGYSVIIEGILGEPRYGAMLRGLAEEFEHVHTYYFDIPFEETLRRHHTKPNAHEFGEQEMREWWKDKDYLGLPGEHIISHSASAEDIVERMLQDIAEA